jgi:hypothetical protein
LWALFLLTTIGDRIGAFLLAGSTLAALHTQAVGIIVLSQIGIVGAIYVLRGFHAECHDLAMTYGRGGAALSW